MSYIGITMGDPSGVGPEITLKAVVQNKKLLNRVVIFGSYQIIDYYRKILRITYPVHVIESIADFKENFINVVNVVNLSVEQIEIGKVGSIAGDAAFQYIETAIKLSMAKEISAIVTAPLNKEALHLGGHPFDGHTEIFATLTKTKKYTMMLWSSKLSVVHVSTHVPLRKACDLVKAARVKECIDLAYDAMRLLGIDNPRIAVAGLNPHSGEAGLFGDEDEKEIKPAVIEKNKEGINVSGPIPPDTVFLKAVNNEFDIVVAMYHDQGHIPMKLLAFDEGVNVTLGLPIIRTSVDHGTAFDIAGKGIANETSMIAAIQLAIDFNNHS